MQFYVISDLELSFTEILMECYYNEDEVQFWMNYDRIYYRVIATEVFYVKVYFNCDLWDNIGIIV
jgi:hypothetical protein